MSTADDAFEATTRRVTEELRAAIEARLAREYGSLDRVPNNEETRMLMKATARDFINALEGDKGITCRIELDGKLHIIASVERPFPKHELPNPNEGTSRNERRLAKKKCSVTDLATWKRARGR
jgi:hypothetical protein